MLYGSKGLAYSISLFVMEAVVSAGLIHTEHTTFATSLIRYSFDLLCMDLNASMRTSRAASLA